VEFLLKYDPVSIRLTAYYKKNVKQFTRKTILSDGSVPQMSLFKHKRVKGWWPFHIKNEGEEMELTVRLT